MKTLCGLAGIFLIITVPTALYGDGYCRNRATTYYTPAYKSYTPTYYAPTYAATYTAPSYDYTPVYQSYLKTQLYPTMPDYHASTSDYYRDKILLDAISGKFTDILKKDREQQEQQALKDQVQALQRQLQYFQQGSIQPLPQQQQQAPPQQQQQQEQPPPQQQRMPRAVGALPPVPEGLQAVVAANCLRCHGATNGTMGGGYDFQNLASIPRDVRLLMKADTDDGHMPKGGKPVDDKAAALFHQFATGRSGAASAQK